MEIVKIKSKKNVEQILKEISEGCQDAELEIISLGMGVQSTAMYFMSCMGVLPRADYAIFADTGSEHNYTYDYLKFLKKYQKENDGIPIIVTKKNPSLYEKIISDDKNGYITIPAYLTDDVGSNAILNRSCTKNYKIEPVYKQIRKLLGLKKFERTNKKVNLWIGITTDEIQRASISKSPITINKFPLLSKVISRKDCIDFYKKNNIPTPKKSACVFCPYNSDKGFIEMKYNNKDEWEKALKVDRFIRNKIKKGSAKAYLHKSKKPLQDVEFKNERQQDLFLNNCEGHCGL